ncbi:MAG: FkbM family methyltransferase, partial [Planctomycetota bacterium]
DRIVGLYSQAHELGIGGNYAQALELYDRIIADAPELVVKTPQINYERALCLKALGQIDQAEQAVCTCLVAKPGHPDSLRLLSEIRSIKEGCAEAKPQLGPEPGAAIVEGAEQAHRLWAEVRTFLPLVEEADVRRALRAISEIEEKIEGRCCGDLRDKLAQYLSIVQFARTSRVETFDSIEIGTLFGGSCLARLFAMRDLGVGGKIVCIDPMSGYYEQQIDPKAGIAVTAEVFFENIARFGFAREAVDLRQVKSSDRRATEGLRERSFAALLIDGDHSYQSVRYDWENYSKFVRGNGIVLFDDYTNGAWPDIAAFADELKGSMPGGWKELGCLGTTLLLGRSVEDGSEQEQVVDKEKIYEGLNKCYFSDQCHEREVIEHLPELLDGVKVFVDIGASLGQYTFHANKYMEEGEIFAIEADPIRFEELKRNCRKWECLSSNQLTALFAAVCEKDGKETFYATNSSKSGGLFKRDICGEPVNWCATVVDCFRLDSLFKNSSPDLVKIDVEGAELRVLRGATKILSEGKTKFLIELHSGVDPEGQSGPDEVLEFMGSFGYTSTNLYGRTLFVNEEKANIKLRACGNQSPTVAVLGQSNALSNAPRNTLREFANKYAGKQAFIIGNGPSLNEMDLTKLKDEITFGVNNIFYLVPRMGFKPTFYVVEDKLVAEDRAEEINSLTGMTKIFGTELQYCLKDSQDVRWANVVYDFSAYPGFPHFSKDASKCLWVGGTVSYLCMQLAYYMGFSEVYLVGFDHNYIIPTDANIEGTVITSVSADRNHFHPDYFGKGRRWHDPRPERMEKAYRRAREVFEADGRKIFNATVGGKLEIFPRVDCESLFSHAGDRGAKSFDFCSTGPSNRAAVKNELAVKQPQSPRFSHLVLDFTRLCNSRCTYCGIWKMRDGPELSLETIKRTFSGLRPYGLSTCYVTGGEPYISDKIVDIARLLHVHLPKCKLSGATNGVQPKKILERMQKILQMGISLEVHVSINGGEATHDATRGGPGFWKKSAYLLETLKSAGVPVVASMSLMPQTIADLPYMQRFCAERDIRLMFSWVRQWERYGSVDKEHSTWPERMKSRLREIEYLPDTFDCPGLSKRLVVTPDGSVYPCEVYNPKILLGNVNEGSVESMLASSRTDSIARLIAERGCAWCQGPGEVDGSPKWMLMDCYRRHSQEYAHLAKQFPQAVNMAPEESSRVIESILSEKSIHRVPTAIMQQSTENRGGEKNSVRISAVICTYRNPELLGSAIESLVNQTLHRDLFEIIVVDNNSGDSTKRVVERYPGVRYVLEEKLGLSQARNAGIGAACGDIIAFIDDDAEACRGWLAALLRVYDAVPEAWAVGGKVLP